MMFSSDLCTVSARLTSFGPWVVFFCCKGSWLGKFPSCCNWSCQVNSSERLGACFCFQLAGNNAVSFLVRTVGTRWQWMPCPTSIIIRWPSIRKCSPMVYLKGRVCVGRVMPGKGNSQAIRTQSSYRIVQGHH